MALKVTYDNPSFEKGTEVGVAGLGVLVNGKAKTISEAEETAFVTYYGQHVKDRLKGDASYTVDGTPSVSDADLKNIVGVDVSDTPSPDPTAMNLGPDGKPFADANLNGADTAPNLDSSTTVPVEEVLSDTPVTGDKPANS